MINNKRLKKYINSNTTSVIRKRAYDCKVIDLIFPNEDSVEATVKGSTGIKYNVKFKGLVSQEIDSSCSCPFDHGNVCKHEVALANEIEAYFMEEIIEFENDKNAIPEKIKYTQTGSIIIDFPSKKSEMDDIIRKYASATVFRESDHKNASIQINDIKEDYAHFLVKGDYWGQYQDVIIRKIDQQLKLHCNCRATNKFLCKHQARTLDYIAKELPDLFASKSQILDQKDKLLKQYGFSVKDETYKQYFSFEYSNGQLIVVPLKEGILKLRKYEDSQTFKAHLLNSESIIKAKLPWIAKKKKEKKKGFSLVFSPVYSDFFIIPVVGNLGKDETFFVSKIEEIDTKYYIEKRKNFNQKQSNIIKSFFKLENSEQDNNLEGYDSLKIQFQILKEIVNQLDETTLLFRLINFPDKKIYPRDLESIEISHLSPRLFFKLQEEEHFYTLKAFIEINGKKVELVKNELVKNAFFIHYKKKYFFYESFYDVQAFLNFNQEPEIRINKIDFESYNEEYIKPLSKQFEIIRSNRKYKNQKSKITDFKKQLYLSEQDDYIVFQPIIEYNQEHFPLFTGKYIEQKDNNQFLRIKRNLDFETHFYEEVKAIHPLFKQQELSVFYLEVDDFLKNAWFLDAFETLKQKEIEIYGSDKLSKLKYNINKPSISTNFNSEVDWFDVEIEIKFGDQLVSLKDVRKSIINKQNFIQLKDGTIGILPKEWLQKYEHAFRAGDVKKDSIKVSNYQLSVIDSLYDEIDVTSELAINYKQVKERLANFKEINTVPAPKGLKAKLRDYQKEGLNWLNFLEEYNFGGCLADDMGLGKTLQIISFLKHLKNTKKPDKASLIVLPTSLIFNWQEEVQKFAPSLKYLVHTGSKRETNSTKFSKVDIVFTTYGILMRDISFLKDYNFYYCILDESQAIKNPNSQRYKSVKLIQANNRLVLTGTPIENNTFDLYAQFNFINPGLLGTMANFKKEFATPIDKNKEVAVAEELRKVIHPFILRRTKEYVAKELPSKTEQILYCTMGDEQQKLYDAYKNKYRDYLLNKISEDGIGKSKMYVLEGLTKLRQICDSPKLLNDKEMYTPESIKIKELINHITEKTGKHKILIFSQFVKMLELIKHTLSEEKIIYEYLDGKTKDRQAKVDNFQNNDEVRVFLISLKAGGTGLNLTAADYVYLVDPWWNPAVEAQAIDRCYRIGQTKKVIAYKMICKGTIEEKIMRYQEGKKQLSADIIQTEESFVKNLSKESITDLFS